MARRKDLEHSFSRRAFLGRMRWAPILFLPAPLQARAFGSLLGETPGEGTPSLDFADLRVRPHYPTNSPLDAVLAKVTPGTDAFVTEKYAFEIQRLLEEWSRGLRAGPPASRVLAKFLDASLEACSLVPSQQTSLRSEYGIDVFRRRFATNGVLGRERFLEEMERYLASMPHLDTAEFEITRIEEMAGSPPLVRVAIRYELVGTGTDARREQRVGQWLTQWSPDARNGWQVRRWEATQEILSRARAPMFLDITSRALGQ